VPLNPLLLAFVNSGDSDPDAGLARAAAGGRVITFPPLSQNHTSIGTPSLANIVAEEWWLQSFSNRLAQFQLTHAAKNLIAPSTHATAELYLSVYTLNIDGTF
jgi:hypothetical protein